MQSCLVAYFQAFNKIEKGAGTMRQLNLQSSPELSIHKKSLTKLKCRVKIKRSIVIKIKHGRKQVSQDLIGNPVQAGAIPPL